MDLDSAYTTLRKKTVFTAADVDDRVSTNRTAYRLIARLQEAGLLARIRNNLYTTIEQDTKRPTATPYQIGCAITKSAYLCRRSALELHGLNNTGIYVDVASETRFHNFTFAAVYYQYHPAGIDLGVITCSTQAGVRLTDYERTVLELIRDYEKLCSLDELIACLHQVCNFDEGKLWQYLQTYDHQFLYQKVGFFGSLQPPLLPVSPSLIEECRRRIGHSSRYLSMVHKSDSTRNATWQLMIPRNVLRVHGWSTV